MLVALLAPCILRSADLSAGTATITTLCFECEVVISFVKEANSRPLSPISPTTITSASALRVIILNKTDLPTPEPAIIPILWPRPIEVMAFILLIPTSKT